MMPIFPPFLKGDFQSSIMKCLKLFVIQFVEHDTSIFYHASDLALLGAASKAPGKRALEKFVAPHPDAVEHGLGHACGAQETGHVDH